MPKHLTKIVEDFAPDLSKARDEERKQRLSMNLGEFARKVEQFSALGKKLYEGGDLMTLAKEINDIAENAEAYIMKEGEVDWFDGVTVKRNMGELKKYVSEFVKVAQEAHNLNQRMTALYEDSGRVLGRYFEIKEAIEDAQAHGSGAAGDDVEQVGWKKSENDKIVNQTIGMKEAVSKCSVCGKPTKENTEGNPKYCQGHSQSELNKLRKKQNESKISLKEEWYRAQIGVKRPAMLGVLKAYAKRYGGILKTDFHNEPEVVRTSPDGKFYEFQFQNPRIVSNFLEFIKKKFGTNVLAYVPDKNEAVTESYVFSFSRNGKLIKEDVTDDYPLGDWTKLDVPKLRYEQGMEFEKRLKKEGYKVLRKDWKERTGFQVEFCEFFVPLKEFNEANEFAVRNYKDFDIR